MTSHETIYHDHRARARKRLQAMDAAEVAELIRDLLAHYEADFSLTKDQ
jgi:hypothetical protein